MSIDNSEIAAYMTGVSSALSDLDADERDDLLDDVHAHLSELAREGGSLTARLGPPDAYAAELRAAAGMPALEASSRSGTLTRLAMQGANLRSHSLVGQAHATARTLAPIWWVTRGYVAAVVLSRLLDGRGWSTRHPWIPHVHGSGTVGMVAVLALVVGSIVVGLRRSSDTSVRSAIALANIALLVVALPLAGRINDGYGRMSPGEVNDALNRQAILAMQSRPLQQGLARDGRPIRNIYPYSRDGRLLLDVLLYDEDGQPIELGRRNETNRRYLTSRAGQQLLNSVPLRYIEPDGNVLHPRAGPRITVPAIVTPSLVPTIGFDPRFAQGSPDPRPPKG